MDKTDERKKSGNPAEIPKSFPKQMVTLRYKLNKNRMKRVSMLLAGLVLYVCTACAHNDRITKDANELPQLSWDFLARHFNAVSVAHIKIEKNLLGVKDYEVILTDGSHVEFTRDGEWKEVKMNRQAVPSAIIPKAIHSYIQQNYPATEIRAIDKDSRDYEVDLNNGIELKFDLQGNLIDVD